ncbi:MAG: hypothetical protein FWD49_07035 [Firmicutes bacterium]|nr:hypothetical protein [Bacillota bacterium]
MSDNNRLNATAFYRLFVERIGEEKDIFIKSWAGKFTDYITKVLKRIVNDDLKLPTYNENGKSEYYNIDVIGWENLYSQLKKEKGFNAYLWNLKIAIEHENKKTDWMDEVVKLWFINCPLRVVISYATKKDRDNLVDYVSCGLAKLPALANGEFLLLLGNSGAKTNEEKLAYRPYLWNVSKTKFEAVNIQ